MKIVFHKCLIITILLFSFFTSYAFEYHVSPTGDDQNSGTATSPLKTIQKAADKALPGDIVTVHAGTYREWINPANGGESPDKRITYRAAQGEKVFIKGSEILTGWKKDKKSGIWMLELNTHAFGKNTSLETYVEGDWFNAMGRKHHTSDIYLNGTSLFEVEDIEKVKHPVISTHAVFKEESRYTWYAEHNGDKTLLYANFGNNDPNAETVEISIRPTCFYPTKKGINYITIQGFDFSQAATQWGAPTAHQVGMIATHWNKGWIIENNTIHDTKCSGITLGKDRETGHNLWSNNREKDGSLHYIEATFNVLRSNWDKEYIGSHSVRNNTIYNCEQTGICGSMGCAFSEISDNHIYNINVKRQFSGAETGGIKFHAAIDTRIIHNHIHQTERGIWLDWMTQGTRVSRNLLYNNISEDLFVEVSHGPYIVDNNIMLSSRAILNQSEGGAYLHNLIAGSISLRFPSSRYTPYQLPHSTQVKGLSIIRLGNDSFMNNLFLPVENKKGENYGLNGYNKAVQAVNMYGNTFYNHANASIYDTKYYRVNEKFKAGLKLTQSDGNVYLELSGISKERLGKAKSVTTETLGKTNISEALFENPDGTPLKIDTDYFGNTRKNSPVCGPFEELENTRYKLY